ncbi:amino acid transporter [Lecanora helva]
MAVNRRHESNASVNTFSKSDYPTGEKVVAPVNSHVGDAEYGDNFNPHQSDDLATHLHRGLRARQVTMIALGGALGSGLLIGTGSALAQAGPGSIFISYTILGFVVWIVLCALGEMAAWLPLESGFTGYATRFCDPALGFSMGYTYWFKYIITTPNQLTACSLVIQYWIDRERVNPGVFIAVFLVVIIAINYLGVRYFGEIEFWLSSAKVLTMCGLIILSLVLMLGGGPDHDRKGFRYWNDPGAFKPLYATGAKGNFLGLWSTFVTATFAYLGSELIGVTVGEAQNPRRVIPRAIKLTFWRILFFYVLSVLLIGTLVRYNSSRLSFATKQKTGASASPFVVAIIESGINTLPGFINACILIFVFSAANSDLYVATRVLYSLAKEGNSHRVFAKTDARGVPIFALGLSSLIACIAFLNVADDSRTVFGYFVSLVTLFGLLTWISILVSHICFIRARRAQGMGNDQMAYTAPLGLPGTYFALVFCIVIAIFNNYGVFVHVKTRANPTFDYKNFITGYLGIPLYLMMIVGYKVVMKSKRKKASEVDLFTGKEAIDREEEDFVARKVERRARKPGNWFYRKFVAWLF